MTDHPARRLYQLRYERRESGSWSYPKDAAHATHVTIEMPNGPYATALTLPVGKPEPDTLSMAEHKRAQVERMIRQAFEAGAAHARAEIRNALGLR